MAVTNRIASIQLTVGEVTATVALTIVNERIALNMVSTQVGSISCQCRLVVLDPDGKVLKTMIINDSDTQRMIIDSGLSGMAGALSAYIECSKGTCTVRLDEPDETEGFTDLPGGLPAAGLADGSVETAKLDSGAVTGPKLDMSSLKVLTAVGNNGASTTATLTGSLAGERIIAVFSTTTAGTAPLIAHVVGTGHAEVILANDEVNQIDVADLSASTLMFFLLPAAA